MKVFFKGYYGFENVGDDIFVHAAKWFSEKNNIKYRIHGYKLPNNIKGVKVKSKAEKLFYDLFYAITSDHIVYWGGSTFERISSKTDLKFWLNKIKRLRNKVSAFSISIGPFNNEVEQNKVLKFLHQINYVGVRDKKSTEYKINADFTFDLAILSPLIFNKDIKVRGNKGNCVSVNLSDAKNYNEYSKVYENFIKINKSDIDEVNIVVFNPNDYKKSLSFYNRMVENGIRTNFYNYSEDTEELIDIIRQTDLLLGNRLHSGIIAYSFKIPFIINEYHSKGTDFLDTIDQEFRFHNLKNCNYKIEEVIYNCGKNKNPKEFREITLKKLEELNGMIKKND